MVDDIATICLVWVDVDILFILLIFEEFNL